MRYLLLGLIIILVGCTSNTGAPLPTYTPYPTYTAYPISTPAPEQVYVQALYDRIDNDEAMLPSTQYAIINLFLNEATVLFDEGSGLILQFNILDVPPSADETSQTALQLIDRALAVAVEQEFVLNGIEVIFFANEQAPFIAFQSKPPWNYEDVLVVPLSPAYVEKLKEKNPSTPTLEVAAETFLKAIQDRVDEDEDIPSPGRNAIIALYVGDPTYVFPDNEGIVLQYIIDHVPEDEQVVDETTNLLIETSVTIAGQHQVPLTGVEVVYLHEGEPWMALASTPPWGADELILVPLHPRYIEQLEKGAVITPTPLLTY